MQVDQDIWSSDLLHCDFSHYPINLLGQRETWMIIFWDFWIHVLYFSMNGEAYQNPL